MYAMVSTRPDISHVDGVVNKFMENLGEEHWRAVKWVIRYLRGRSDHCIIFDGREGLVGGYVDADYAGDLGKMRSTISYVFSLVGGAVSWMSKLQETVALSTTEVEYIDASNAYKEAISLKCIIDEIGRTQEKVNVLCDNESAIHLATNPEYNRKSKPIDGRYHFVRHMIDGGKVVLNMGHTQENHVDVFTKPVTVEKLRWCVDYLGL